MIKKLEIKEYETLKETSINIECGLLTDYNRGDFLKQLIELVDSYHSYSRNEK